MTAAPADDVQRCPALARCHRGLIRRLYGVCGCALHRLWQWNPFYWTAERASEVCWINTVGNSARVIRRRVILLEFVASLSGELATEQRASLHWYDVTWYE